MGEDMGSAPEHVHTEGDLGHQHATEVTQSNERRIRLVFLLTAGYALVQAIGGWIAGSLALIADAGHMISDSAALLLALVAYRVARWPIDAQRTYGFHRVRVLAALANGATLLLLVAWIAWEAVQRINQPAEILAGPMLIVATIGLLVNLIGAYALWSGDSGDSNLRGALLHVVGDLLGSIGAITAAVGIMLTGWAILDPLLSVLGACLVIRSAWGLVSDSIRVLLQATPKGIDATEIEASLRDLPGIAEVGHFHAWTLTDESIIATVHVSADQGADPLSLPPLVASWLQETRGIDHVTVQVDPRGSLLTRHT
jgi:cobalt-zinc-cadmium efflux system protein